MKKYKTINTKKIVIHTSTDEDKMGHVTSREVEVEVTTEEEVTDTDSSVE